MISVRSLLQLLNGNNNLLIIICLLVACGTQSCGILSPATKDPSVTKNKNRRPPQPDEDLPPIQGTRVYDPVKQEWVVLQKPPEEPLDTLQIVDLPSTQIPPITMDNVESYAPSGMLSGTTANSSGQIKIAVLLPFLSSRGFDDSGTNAVTQWAVQFYGGLKMALADLESEGMNMKVDVIDTEANPTKVQNIIATRPALDNADMIIGPYRRDNIRILAEYAKRTDKILVSPYSASTNLTKENPNYIQVSPSLETHCQNLIQHALREFQPEEIVLVGRNIPIEKSCLATIQEEYFKMLGTTQADSLEMYIPAMGDENFQDVEILPYLENRDKIAFVIPSWADESFIYALMRKIDIERRPYQRVVVYGLPQWMRFEHIDYEYFEKLNVRVSSNFYLDRTDERIATFQRDFYDKYGTIPSEEAYIGYDIMLYFARMLRKYGDQLPEKIDSEESRLFHTEFNFQKVVIPTTTGEEFLPTERLENKYVNILEFRNYAFELSTLND